MGLLKTSKTSVSPGVAAFCIITALAIVQYVWWKGLITKTPLIPPGPMRGGMPPPAGIDAIPGVIDGLVETLSGDPDPGLIDGPGRDARFDGPSGLSLDKQGYVIVADSRNHRIRSVNQVGKTSPIAGSEIGFADGPAAAAKFRLPTGTAVGSDNVIYVADAGNHRIRSIKGGVVSTVAGSVEGFADGPAASAKFKAPCALAWDDVSKSLLIADSGNRKVRRLRIGASGSTVETVAETPGQPTGITIRGGSIYVTMPDAGLMTIGQAVQPKIKLGPPDGGEQVQQEVLVQKPVCVAASAKGIWLAGYDQGSLIRIEGAGAQVMAGTSVSKGIITAFRDGTGNRAGLSLINGIVDDGHGHVWFADTANNAIRRFTLPEAVPAGALDRYKTNGGVR